MKKLTIAGRICYGGAMAAIGAHQLITTYVTSMLFPIWPVHVPGIAVLTCIFSFALVAVGIAIATGKKARVLSLILGGVLLVLFCFNYVPYEIFIDPTSKHLGVWPFKELAFAGGAFVIAGCYPLVAFQKKSTVIRFLAWFIPLGPWFFAIMLVCFGIDHFLYTTGIAVLVPAWIPGPIFWTYLAGVQLIASGISFALKIWVKFTALLLGCTILTWLFIIHIPLAMADPIADKGNAVTSALSAVVFIGISFMIAGSQQIKKLQLNI